jgi:hypothetical protein
MPVSQYGRPPLAFRQLGSHCRRQCWQVESLCRHGSASAESLPARHGRAPIPILLRAICRLPARILGCTTRGSTYLRSSCGNEALIRPPKASGQRHARGRHGLSTCSAPVYTGTVPVCEESPPRVMPITILRSIWFLQGIHCTPPRWALPALSAYPTVLCSAFKRHRGRANTLGWVSMLAG